VIVKDHLILILNMTNYKVTGNQSKVL